MSEEPPLNEKETSVVQSVKRTMSILAKVIRDKDVKEVIKDKDLADLIGNRSLDDALADPELGPKIRERVTPDLPQLNAEQEALVVSQLGAAVFGRLIEAESNNDDGPG